MLGDDLTGERLKHAVRPFGTLSSTVAADELARNGVAG